MSYCIISLTSPDAIFQDSFKIAAYCFFANRAPKLKDCSVLSHCMLLEFLLLSQLSGTELVPREHWLTLGLPIYIYIYISLSLSLFWRPQEAENLPKQSGLSRFFFSSGRKTQENSSFDAVLSYEFLLWFLTLAACHHDPMKVLVIRENYPVAFVQNLVVHFWFLYCTMWWTPRSDSFNFVPPAPLSTSFFKFFWRHSHAVILDPSRTKPLPSEHEANWRASDEFLLGEKLSMLPNLK